MAALSVEKWVGLKVLLWVEWWVASKAEMMVWLMVVMMAVWKAES
jgi:hypothetical protein